MRNQSIQFVAIGAAFIISTQSPGLANVNTYSGDGDQRLYIREVTNNVTRADLNWNKSAGSASYYSGPVSNVGIYMGQFRISDERFIQIIEGSSTASWVVSNYRSRQSTHNWITWGGILGGAAMVYYGAYRSSLGSILPGPLSYAGVAVVGLGLGSAIASPRYFTLEEAARAVDEYNAKL